MASVDDVGAADGVHHRVTGQLVHRDIAKRTAERPYGRAAARKKINPSVGIPRFHEILRLISGSIVRHCNADSNILPHTYRAHQLETLSGCTGAFERCFC
jgi:hypothetical protein